MDPNRRYSDDEIAQILDDATETQTSRDHALSSSEGLTLAELQEIGREAGIGTDLVRAFTFSGTSLQLTGDAGGLIQHLDWQRV